MMRGGELFILKMPVVKLGDLADVIINEYSKKYGYTKESIKKKIIGRRAGEKIFEELMTEMEGKLAYETDDMFIVPPHSDSPIMKFSPSSIKDYSEAKKSTLQQYTSRDIKPLSKKDIKTMLFS
jgi:UDP-N-acetylglucosamine 4,6-dehydratase